MKHLKRIDKARELGDEINRLAAECKLDNWTELVDEIKVPAEIYPALMSGRPELIKLIQPRDLTADESKVLFDIIGTLIKTNTALRDHAEQVAQFVDNWAGAFAQLRSAGAKIQRFANFEHADMIEEEE